MGISLGVTPATVAPGGSVVVAYDAGSEDAGTVSVGVRGLARYIVGERGRDANGQPITREVMHADPFHDDQQEVAPGAGQASFQLPAGAPVASAGVVEWIAWATSGDRTQRAEIEVRLAPPAPSDPAADTSANGITLHGVTGAAAGGGSVTGTMIVDVPEHIKAHNVAIRLVRRCTYVAEPVASWDGHSSLAELASQNQLSAIIHDDWIATADVFGKTEFNPGAPQQASFELAIPADAGPSTAHPRGQVEWRVEAALHRILHDDLTVVVPVAVY